NSLAVIGAGYISVEIAGLMHHLGVKTDLFVRKEAPLRSFDPYIVQSLVEEMEKTGLQLHTYKIPLKLEKLDDGLLE
ncbi:NAD-binding protein, partial [Streptococcus pyogenes]